jgi:phosphoribosylanthranilate isomerase
VTEIKFCGMTRPEDAEYAASIGAAYVGAIFAGGPRLLTLDRAKKVFANVPRAVRRVGVFADQGADEIIRLAAALELSVVQLHAGATAARVREIRAGFSGDIWPVYRVSGSTLGEDIWSVADLGEAVVFDSHVPGVLGGTGVPLPWKAISREMHKLSRMGWRFVLAGGLRPENIETAMMTLMPDVVDVSSGVESAPGIKDHDRMRAFRDAVASLDAK